MAFPPTICSAHLLGDPSTHLPVKTTGPQPWNTHNHACHTGWLPSPLKHSEKPQKEAPWEHTAELWLLYPFRVASPHLSSASFMDLVKNEANNKIQQTPGCAVSSAIYCQVNKLSKLCFLYLLAGFSFPVSQV